MSEQIKEKQVVLMNNDETYCIVISKEDLNKVGTSMLEKLFDINPEKELPIPKIDSLEYKTCEYDFKIVLSLFKLLDKINKTLEIVSFDSSFRLSLGPNLPLKIELYCRNENIVLYLAPKLER